MKQWYCWIEGQQYGPADLNELREWIQHGRLHPGDNVWCEGMAEWTPAGNLPELFPAGYAAAPAQGAPAAPAAPTGPGAPFEPPVPGAAPPTTYPGKGLCTASLVLGIVSLPCLCCYGIGGILLGVPGLILGIIGVRQAREANAPHGMGSAGIVLSIIGILLGLIVLVVFIAIVAASEGGGPDFSEFDFDV